MQYVYELLYQGEGADGSRFMMGLIDVDELRKKLETMKYDGNRAGQNGGRSGLKQNRAALGRGPVGPQSGPGRDGEVIPKSHDNGSYTGSDGNSPEKHYIELKNILHRIVITPVWGFQLFNIACNYLQAEYERESSSSPHCGAGHALAASEPPATGTHG